MTFENTLQYVTFADRTQVENRIEDYDTLMVTSHLLAGGKKAVTSLLHNLIDSHDLEYYINPTVTEFQLGDNFRNPDGSLREWHSKLISELGEPFSQLASGRDNIRWEHLDAEEKENAIESICNFQCNFVGEAVEEEMGKYANILSNLDLSPRAVIPWYTLIRDYEDISDNEEIIRLSRESCDLPLKPCIHTTADFISDVNARRSLANHVGDLDLHECFIWIDNLDKNFEEVTARTYRNVAHLTALISEEGVDPQFLFGDFYSNILYYFGLRGTSYGTYFRESSAEKVERVPGGGSLQRYYYDSVKEFLSVPVSVTLGRITREPIPDFDGFSDWDDLLQVGEDHDFLKNHYILTRKSHKNKIHNQNLSTVIEELEEDFDRYDPLLDGLDATNKNVDHLEKWIDGVNQFETDYEDIFERVVEETRQLPTSNWA